MRQLGLIDRVAAARGLDAIAGAVRDATHKLLRPGTVKDALHGVWLGHPLHPALAQLPVGAFLSAAVLDITGDRGPGAGRLIGCGVVASVPAALAGLADYADGHEEQQRVGIVHAALNSAALLSYLGSLTLRARNSRAAGVALGLVGCALATAGATLGGDLSFRRAAGPNHAAEVPHSGPADWTDLGSVDAFAGTTPVRAHAGLISVLVVRSGDGFAVLHDRCGHMAAPLHQGRIVEHDGVSCVECPWHGSVFRLADGAVVHGPATAPQPVLDSRIRGGRLEAKVREIPGVAAS
ncbi:MAG TPA: Rieske 2Fe-2S domain-containing protein [Pseudonocardiaceae bacterium]|nr:Rieske 2Fe-2S domain-containing protein [Pseudonocardiaceae bacterium]